jgi:maltose 6'-phosphate phosphatase
MQKHLKHTVLSTILLFLVPVHASAWWWDDSHQCYGVGNGPLNVMTINLLFSEIEDRDRRLMDIAEYATDPDNNIHIILLQEVVGGLLVDTPNSAKDLQEMLEWYGASYNLKTAFETGLPGLLAVANSILSRCEIKFTLVKRLSRASEIEFGGRVIRLPRNVQMARIKIPGHGRINVYNTHWCAGCSVEELLVHSEETLRFINAIETFLPGDDPVIFGGDLNLDRFRENEESGLQESALYDGILNQGFSDAYADFMFEEYGVTLDTLCKESLLAYPDEDYPDEHCTIGVAPEYGDSTPRRIDYVFVQHVEEVTHAEVVFGFNADTFVSDHSAVVVGITLP